MTLRRWLLLWIVGGNLLVLGALQVVAVYVYRQSLPGQYAIYERYVALLLADAYDGERRAVSTTWIGKALSIPDLDTWCRDILISTGRGDSSGSYSDLNPLGAAHRDADSFPIVAIQTGLQQALERRETVRAAGGFCVPVQAGPEALAAAWYVPIDQQAPIGIAMFAIWLTAGLMLLAFVTYRVERQVVQPLGRLTEIAARFGSGDQTARAEADGASEEIRLLAESFNRMAVKVSGHTHELQLAVAEATDQAAKRERALLTSSRLVAIGTLAAGIAHEINNPIGGMTNAVRRLQRNPELTDKDRTYLELIQEGLDRVSRIARRVLDFSPREVVGRDFALAGVVEAARALVDHRLDREGVELTVSGAHDIVLHGDPHEIQQVLLNLFLNSLDAFESMPRPRHIAVDVRRHDGVVEVVVADDGPGLSRELLPRVFDPFFSKKSRPDATGLGMFISYSIVRNHGGRIDVDSEPGKGFRVVMEFPDPAAGPPHENVSESPRRPS